MKCPGCGKEGPFTLYTALCQAHVGSDNSVQASHIEWCEDDTCTCDLCGHTADAGDFEEVRRAVGEQEAAMKDLRGKKEQ